MKIKLYTPLYSLLNYESMGGEKQGGSPIVEEWFTLDKSVLDGPDKLK